MDTTTTQIKQATEAKAAALASVEDIKRQIQELTEQAAAAKSKLEALRSDDAGDIGEIARSCAEQSAILEIAAARRIRLDKQLRETNGRVNSWNEHLRKLTDQAGSALQNYRRHKRIGELREYVAGWISPDSLKNNAITVGLKTLIYDLSAHDRSLDPVSLVAGNHIRQTRVGTPDDAGQFILQNAEEAEIALSWVAQKAEATAGRPYSGHFDPAQEINLYSTNK